MATTFPNEIQTFTTAVDVSPSDGILLAQYQQAKENGNFSLAAQIFAQIPQADQKIISANKINTIIDTCYALEKYYLEKFSPAYIVSATQPSGQETGDFWFEVTG